MDTLQYVQYKLVVESGQISLDGLKRIIKHDFSSCLARMKVVQDCENGLINFKKLYDEKGDYLYGNNWPLPLDFELRQTKCSPGCDCLRY